MWHWIPMAKQGWDQRSWSWKLDHICCTSSGLHFNQHQSTIWDVIKVIAWLYTVYTDVLFPWHLTHTRVRFSTITKKALRLLTALFSWTLGFFSPCLFYCALKRELLQLKKPQIFAVFLSTIPIFLIDDVQATCLIPACLSRLPPWPSCKKHQCVSQQHIWSSDRTEDMHHYFYRLTSACFTRDEPYKTNTTRSSCF